MFCSPPIHLFILMLFKYQKLYYKIKKTEPYIKFLVKCQDNNLTPKFIRWKNLKSKRHKLRSSYHRRLLKESIHEQHKSLASLKTSFNEYKHQLKSNTWFRFTAITLNATKTSDKKLDVDKERHQRKFSSLLHEHSVRSGIKNNPKTIITTINDKIGGPTDPKLELNPPPLAPFSML